MQLRLRRRAASPGSDAISGIARIDKRTKRLIGRLEPGEIAVIDHRDIDRIAAEGLVERKVRAVINASSSCTGSYPNLGPLVLTGAGIHLIDDAGLEIFSKIKEGDLLTIDEASVYREGELVATGEIITTETAAARLDSAKVNISAALESFAENTLSYMLTERDFVLEAIRLPEIATNLAHRHVLVVVRGYGYKEDLASLSRGYIKDFRPVLLAVDGGADALLALKLKPDIIIGDMDSVTTRALSCGAELVVHAYPGGTAPGKARLDALGLQYSTFEAAGTSEDVAMLLAHEKGAELIVAVGTRSSLVELMDKGRKGMASTFLVRMRVGPKLVDAKGVSELHRSGASGWEIAGLLVAAVMTMVIVILISQPMRLVVEAIVDLLKDAWFMIGQAL